ncbi:PREDICTED: mitochondrial substrate carrier family protein W-like [Ipomoea nil]|uniref:mitochondrial substrate carrier family protein W-like n=1 Tax=Ipomoea nil TaxID=35883 RepID=UPI000901251F|nr:PREDICTED: mitochondrial substrate carrier family protein W-like [Ipomoea nil]
MTYSVAHRLVWSSYGCYFRKRDDNGNGNGCNTKTVMVVQGLSAAMAGGISAFITMLDTIKTRLQFLDRNDNGVGQTLRNLVRKGGWRACYRGLGPRWASMSMSTTIMITTYEFLKRLSTKNQDY